MPDSRAPILAALSLHSDAGRILRLDPRRVRAPIDGALDALGHDALAYGRTR
jgi:hypothetical protein